MATTLAGPQLEKINFAGMVGPKRRRMRSGGNVSTLTNNVPKGGVESIEEDEDDRDGDGDGDDEKTTQTSKCKGSTTIPIFLKSE
jgi:hypothetical protein